MVVQGNQKQWFPDKAGSEIFQPHLICLSAYGRSTVDWKEGSYNIKFDECEGMDESVHHILSLLIKYYFIN